MPCTAGEGVRYARSCKLAKLFTWPASGEFRSNNPGGLSRVQDGDTAGRHDSPRKKSEIARHLQLGVAPARCWSSLHQSLPSGSRRRIAFRSRRRFSFPVRVLQHTRARYASRPPPCLPLLQSAQSSTAAPPLFSPCLCSLRFPSATRYTRASNRCSRLPRLAYWGKWYPVACEETPPSHRVQ